MSEIEPKTCVSPSNVETGTETDTPALFSHFEKWKITLFFSVKHTHKKRQYKDLGINLKTVSLPQDPSLFEIWPNLGLQHKQNCDASHACHKSQVLSFCAS